MKQKLTFILSVSILILSGILTLIAMNQDQGYDSGSLRPAVSTPSPVPTATPMPSATPTPKPGDEPLPTPTMDPFLR